MVLLVGAPGLLRDAALADLRERVLGGGPTDFNEDRYDFGTSGTDPQAVLTAAQMLPMMAARRLVQVRGLSDRRAKKFLESALPVYLESPPETTCLLLVCETIDKRTKWVKQIAQVGEVREVNGPTRPAELRSWVEGRVRESGKRAGRGMAAALVDLVGADPGRLAAEVEKLSLYVGDRREIGPDDVEEVTAQLRAGAVFDLTDAIGERRVGPALAVLAKLQAQGEPPLAVLGALGNHFRRLIRARECKPLEPKEVQRRLALHPFAARKLTEQARRFEPRRLRRCLDAVRRTDDALKGGVALPPPLAIERLVLAVCG